MISSLPYHHMIFKSFFGPGHISVVLLNFDDIMDMDDEIIESYTL